MIQDIKKRGNSYKILYEKWGIEKDCYGETSF